MDWRGAGEGCVRQTGVLRPVPSGPLLKLIDGWLSRGLRGRSWSTRTSQNPRGPGNDSDHRQTAIERLFRGRRLRLTGTAGVIADRTAAVDPGQTWIFNDDPRWAECREAGFDLRETDRQYRLASDRRRDRLRATVHRRGVLIAVDFVRAEAAD